MNNDDFHNFYEQHFPARTWRERRLSDLATQYATECEAYDRTVCTGPIGSDGIMPSTGDEVALINRNALKVFKRLAQEAESYGIWPQELLKAISRWRP